MERTLQQIRERISVLNKAIGKAKKEGPSFPEGHLRISTNDERIRYYHITEPGDYAGMYITNDKLDLAEALAQKDYNEHFLKNANYELTRLERLLSQMTRINADLAFQKLPDGRKALVKPYITTDELYSREWQATPFKDNPFMPENKIYDTQQGEKVRSKSEAILADMLYEMGIPYHYEKPLRLNNGSIRYPDFTLLHVQSRSEIYLEHFGMLDDEAYLNSCLRKLDEYRQSGIYLGNYLLITYETAEYPLDIKGIRKMMKKLLK